MFTFLTVLFVLSVLVAFTTVLVVLSELSSYSMSTELIKGGTIIFIISIATSIFCAAYTIQDRWVLLDKSSDYSLSTIVYTDIKTKVETEKIELKLTYQDINNDIDIDTSFPTDYIDKVKEPTSRLYVNIKEKSLRGKYFYLWLKHKQGNKYFWKKLTEGSCD